jgi:Rv2525c-like, glycoside hydrolase-like domain
MTELRLAGRKRWIDFRGVPRSWDVFYSIAKGMGITGALRYTDAGSEGKQIHSAERQAAFRQGIDLLLVDELNTGDAWDSANDRAAGVVRGRAALADAKAEGFGKIGIAAAADAHAPSLRHISDAVMYATGFASVVGKEWAGFYGFMETLRAVRTANVVSWLWLAGSKPSAEDARWVAFWQDNTGTIAINGVECDVNWRLDGPIPGAEVKEEEDVDQTEVIKDSGPGRLNHTWLNTNQVLNNRTFGLAAIGAQLKALTAAVAVDKGVPEERLQEMLDVAVAKALPIEAVMQAIREAVPEEMADDVVRKVGERLSAQD